jgi:hypothetical protein
MKLQRRQFLHLAAGAAALPVVSRFARAQSYPTRSIKIVVPATPGGAIDVIARLVADKLTASMGQPVVVENKPGASNNLHRCSARARPTVFTGIVAVDCATNKFLFKQLPGPVTDFGRSYPHVVPVAARDHPATRRTFRS